ncbi:MAG: fluoride efflux transporter CrcB [Geminocystis sp.]|nr:fluoride efflux transporter CrcB [Geminocystis sp.]HIK37912.1 fluoride efflux transporter CrcB [Geminocystis sp. M7585_C2015_104]MCS7147014.1 fluoride efflux transporter CrcB [Geminocystis sp.]MCX8077326.1 fluoride efflux transporter CrcB [Geminocystis sp.]MDW8115838.1 fluoride efflux transporter CrcB [Geminocystis sp.]
MAVSLGAIGGALSRYYLETWLYHKGIGLPLAHMLINSSGCLLMGLFVTLAIKKNVPPEIRLLVSVGGLGSFTTFSSYQLDASTIWDNGNPRESLVYWISSPLLGIVCLQVGNLIAHRWPQKKRG